MHKGLQAHFQEINRKGGIKQHKIELIALDDGYDPGSAREKMRELITQHNVLAVVGNVGTPTAKEALPLARQHQVPFIGAFTGSSILRKHPPERFIANLRASYKQEMATILKTLLASGITPEEIAFFSQDDAFGDSGFDAALEVFSSLGVTLDQYTHGRYQRNTLDIAEGLIDILNADVQPKAIVLLATYKPAAKFIRLAQKSLPDVYFFNISFVGSHALSKALGDCCDRIYTTQVVPPLNSESETVLAYKTALDAYSKNSAENDVSFEGYLVGRFITDIIKNSPSLTRAGLIDVISKTDVEKGVNVWLTEITKGHVLAISQQSLIKQMESDQETTLPLTPPK